MPDLWAKTTVRMARKNFVNRFLKLLFSIFGASARKISGGPAVAKDESVTRFVFDRDHIRRSQPKPTAKFQVFLPRNGETSVFRVSYLSDAEVWELGNDHVAKLRNRTIKARADIKVQQVESVGAEKGHVNLTVVPETSMHLLHANIVGWPEDEGAVQMIAVELANKAEVHVP